MTHDFDKGLREFRGTKVFITTGIGLGGLPFRFLMPPVIDILEIEWHPCHCEDPAEAGDEAIFGPKARSLILLNGYN